MAMLTEGALCITDALTLSPFGPLSLVSIPLSVFVWFGSAPVSQLAGNVSQGRWEQCIHHSRVVAVWPHAVRGRTVARAALQKHRQPAHPPHRAPDGSAEREQPPRACSPTCFQVEFDEIAQAKLSRPNEGRSANCELSAYQIAHCPNARPVPGATVRAGEGKLDLRTMDERPDDVVERRIGGCTGAKVAGGD